MADLYEVEIEPETRAWLESLSDRDFGRVDLRAEVKTVHDSYENIAHTRRGSAEYREGYEEARRAFLIGQAVRGRRLELGLSQTEVAARAGMTQPALSRLEAGGAVPTIPILERLAAALSADLVVSLAPHAA